MKNNLVYAFIISLQGYLTFSRECSQAIVNVCLKPLTKFDKEINAAVVVYLEEEDLREHCRLYEEYSNCMKDVRPQCSRVDRLVFEGVDDSYHYLCDEKFDEYLEHRECLKNPELHEEGSACNDTLTDKLDDLDGNRTATWRRDRICQYAEDYLDCVQNAVKSFCGADAGLWQRGLDERGLWPLLDEINCPGFNGRPWWETNDKGTDMFVIIVIIVLMFICVVIIVLAVLMFRMYRKKKAQREARAARRANRSTDAGPYVSYGNGVAMVHGVEGGQAGPLPDKGMLPPAYTLGPAANGGSGEEGMPPPMHMMAEGGLAVAVGLPPAYSDIGDEKRGQEGHDNLGASGENSNPMYDNGSNPLYDNNAAASTQRSQAGSERY